MSNKSVMSVSVLSVLCVLVDLSVLMAIAFVGKLEVVHKEVEGCLISYNLQLACIRKLEVIWPLVSDQMWAHCCVDCSNRLIIIHSVSDSHCIVGIDLLGQLKILTLLEFPLTPPRQTIFNRALSSLANIRQFWLIWIVEITTLMFALIQRKSDLAYCCDIPVVSPLC